MQTIGQIARSSGISIETIRFYEQERLLPKTPRTAAGYRLYDQHAVNRLRFISRAKTLGFTLTEIREILNLQDSPDSSHQGRAEIKAITEKRLLDIAQRIADLQRMQTVLTKLSSECSGHGSAIHCPIVETLSGMHDSHLKAHHDKHHDAQHEEHHHD